MHPHNVLATFALLTLTACATPGAAPDADLDGALARRAKVSVCHVTSSGKTREISVSSAAVPSLLKRGDHLAGAWYPDDDGDGFGDADASPTRCKVDSTDVDDNTDCNDGAATAYPGNEEVGGDGIDNDCDGDVDEGSGCPCSSAFDLEPYLTDYDDLYQCADAYEPTSTLTQWVFQANTLDSTGRLQDTALLFAEDDGVSLRCVAVVGTVDSDGIVTPVEVEAQTGLTTSEFDACLDDISAYQDDYGCDFSF